MPSYKVKAPGFFNGKLYSPTHPIRNKLHTDKAFPKGKTPPWLELIKAETAAERKKREAAEKAKKDKRAADDKEVADVNFMEGNTTSSEASKSSVETL